MLNITIVERNLFIKNCLDIILLNLMHCISNKTKTKIVYKIRNSKIIRTENNKYDSNRRANNLLSYFMDTN